MLLRLGGMLKDRGGGIDFKLIKTRLDFKFQESASRYPTLLKVPRLVCFHCETRQGWGHFNFGMVSLSSHFNYGLFGSNFKFGLFGSNFNFCYGLFKHQGRLCLFFVGGLIFKRQRRLRRGGTPPPSIRCTSRTPFPLSLYTQSDLPQGGAPPYDVSTFGAFNLSSYIIIS
jgi:hypothetical protein